MFTTIRRAAVAGLVTFSAFAAHATSILPDTGLWGFDAEANGQPGRGFQIDKQQGRLILFTYMGYRADGSPTFLQAGGEQAESTFEGDLVEFRGGTPLGGRLRSAQAAGSAGRMKIVFDTSTTGTLTLPGEAPQRVSRVVYEDNSSRFNATFLAVVSVGPFPPLSNGFSMTALNGVLTMDFGSKAGSSLACKYSGRYSLAGSGIASTGTFSCNQRTGTYRTEDFVVDAHGLLQGRIFRTFSDYPNEEPALELQGRCIGTDSATIGGIVPRCNFKNLP